MKIFRKIRSIEDIRSRVSKRRDAISPDELLAKAVEDNPDIMFKGIHTSMIDSLEENGLITPEEAELLLDNELCPEDAPSMCLDLYNDPNVRRGIASGAFSPFDVYVAGLLKSVACLREALDRFESAECDEECNFAIMPDQNVLVARASEGYDAIEISSADGYGEEEYAVAKIQYDREDHSFYVKAPASVDIHIHACDEDFFE